MPTMSPAVHNSDATFKVAVHLSYTVTKRGFVYKQHPRFIVVGGPNPFGPRGGHQGVWVDGVKLSPLYRTRKEAEVAAALELQRRGLPPQEFY